MREEVETAPGTGRDIGCHRWGYIHKGAGTGYRSSKNTAYSHASWGFLGMFLNSSEFWFLIKKCNGDSSYPRMVVFWC